MDDDAFCDSFGAQVAALPGVLAVALGGSRALGSAASGADWDFALYYRGDFDADVVRAQGWAGEVTDPGGWGGGVMNGGAWLEVDDRRVDLIYRDLDEVELWWAEARAGRFEKQLLLFYVAGIPTYTVVAELAINRVLHGELPRPEYPDALAVAAADRWHRDAALSLWYAQKAFTDRGDTVVATANLTRAIIEESHARLAARKEWVLNEKGIAGRAGLDHMLERPLADALAAAAHELS
jgi:hypothetical protein